MCGKPFSVGEFNRAQPELGQGPIVPHVNVRRFIVLVTEEKESIWSLVRHVHLRHCDMLQGHSNERRALWAGEVYVLRDCEPQDLCGRVHAVVSTVPLCGAAVRFCEDPWPCHSTSIRERVRYQGPNARRTGTSNMPIEMFSTRQYSTADSMTSTKVSAPQGVVPAEDYAS